MHSSATDETDRSPDELGADGLPKLDMPPAISRLLHTPAPWTLVEIENERGELTHCVCAPNGNFITYALPRTFAHPELLANARLLAAAPKLLEALHVAEGFISGFEDDASQEGINWILQTIRTAISATEAG